MLVLIAVSFIRFHIVRGYQYRKRHQADDPQQQQKEDQTMATTDVTSFPVSGVPNGNVPPPAIPSTSGATPDYMTMFLEFSRDENRPDLDRKYVGRRSGSRVHSMDLGTTENSRHSGRRRPKRTLSADLEHQRISKGPTGSGKKSGGNSKQQRPLAYTFNANGSMVDVRCSDDERTKTFRLLAECDETKPGSGNEDVDDVISGLPCDDDSVVIVVAADDYYQSTRRRGDLGCRIRDNAVISGMSRPEMTSPSSSATVRYSRNSASGADDRFRSGNNFRYGQR